MRGRLRRTVPSRSRRLRSDTLFTSTAMGIADADGREFEALAADLHVGGDRRQRGELRLQGARGVHQIWTMRPNWPSTASMGLVASASSEPSSSNLLYSFEMKEISLSGSKAMR